LPGIGLNSRVSWSFLAPPIKNFGHDNWREKRQTGVPLLLSSRCTVFALGVIIIAGSVAAYIFYWEAFVSVWCFFAAAASVVILMYFEQSRRTRVRVAGA
jgi:hypothetical protein